MRILRFCCQEVLQGTLHAFDLAGNHGLLPDLREDKKVRIGHGEDGPVQSAQGVISLRQQRSHQTGQIHRRQRRRDESSVAGRLLDVTANAGSFVFACVCPGSVPASC
jgi:hypothetical protein